MLPATRERVGSPRRREHVSELGRPQVWGAGPGGLAAAMTVVGAAFAASQALLVRPLVAKLGAADALRAGYCCSAVQRVFWMAF